MFCSFAPVGVVVCLMGHLVLALAVSAVRWQRNSMQRVNNGLSIIHKDKDD
jgi:hypothetical protein